MADRSNSRIVTTHVLNEMKRKGEKIAMLTAYDYSMAKILDAAGIDANFTECVCPPDHRRRDSKFR